MYTISSIIEDISRGCVANNLNEDYFSYRIIFYVNENGIGTKHYINTSYGDLRKVLENIIREHLSITNSVAVAQVTVLKGGKSVSLLSSSYVFSLDEYFRQIYGRCKNDSENRNTAYGRLAYAVQQTGKFYAWQPVNLTVMRKGGNRMQKYYIIIAHDGTEIIDDTPEAEDRIATMDYLERRYKRERGHKHNRQRKVSKNPLYRLACLCGIV